MMASINACPRTTLDAPCNSASFAPAVLIIFKKIQITMLHGFGCSGCIREKSARWDNRSAAQFPSKGGPTTLHIVLECRVRGGYPG